MVAFGISKSCLLVLSVLSSSGYEGISQKELLDKTQLSARSVKYALKKLKTRGYALEKILSRDLRCKKYYFGGEK